MTWFTPDAGLPPANVARIHRATEALALAVLCLSVDAGFAARFTEPLLVVNTVVVVVMCVLAWLARLAYGWLRVSPFRHAVARVIRLAPLALAGVGGVTDVVLAAGTSAPYGWAVASLLVMMVAAAAAGVAGSAR